MFPLVRCRPLLTLICALGICGPSVPAAAKPVPPFAQALELEEPRAPWAPRARFKRKRRPRHMPALGMALIDLESWPVEPASPSPVVRRQFADALRRLCGGRPRLSKQRARRYAKWIISAGRWFQVDPFLLAGLAYRQSRCDPRIRRGHRGGLTSLGWRTHRRFIKRKAYHYWVLQDGEWIPRTRRLRRYRFNPWTLRRSMPSLYFAAALLSIYNEQCPDIDSRFGSVPHRHPVSHLIWGDKVPDAGSEDRILEARRRLIEYYEKAPPVPVGAIEGMPLYLPLDGVPRKVSSGLGDVRGGGHHAHRGLDFESTRGEPVRAIADGVVFRAGVDLPKRGSRPLRPNRSHWYPRWRMGRGGLMVLIRHDNGMMSAYMHLDRFVVRDEQLVRGGQVIGYVGRTGIKRDPAHLHFELRKGRRVLDPIPLFGPAVFPPTSTYRGYLIKSKQPRLWRLARYRRWRRRRASLHARMRKRRVRRARRRLATKKAASKVAPPAAAPAEAKAPATPKVEQSGGSVK